MTTPTTQREADERAQKALITITDRLALTYRICCGTSPKQSVGELLDVTIKMPEWEIVRAAIDQSTRQAAPEVPAIEVAFDITDARGPATQVIPAKSVMRHADGSYTVFIDAPAATDQPSAGQVDERTLFEQEANAARFFPRELDFSLTKSPSGRDEYANSHLQSRWEGWQAGRVSLPPAAPQAAAPDERRNIAEVKRTSDMGLSIRFLSARACSAFDRYLAAPQAASVSGERCYACRGCGHEVVGGRAVGICDVCKGTGSAPQAASQQAETVVGASETGWLIEVKGFQSPLWLKADGSTTADANDALRFGREQDASAFLSVFLTAKCGDDAVAVYKRRLGADCYTVTEHIWHSAAAPQAATTATCQPSTLTGQPDATICQPAATTASQSAPLPKQGEAHALAIAANFDVQYDAAKGVHHYHGFIENVESLIERAALARTPLPGQEFKLFGYFRKNGKLFEKLRGHPNPCTLASGWIPLYEATQSRTNTTGGSDE